MIAFGACVGSREQLEQILRPGIAKSCAGEPCPLIEGGTPGQNTSIFRVYNEILTQARTMTGLEALVLAHVDLELKDASFLAKVRSAMKIPKVAVVGTVGGEYVQEIGWWTAKGPRKGYARDTVNGTIHYGFDGIDVHVVDGLMLILSPWAIANLRFDDERFDGFHGYDADICTQARSRGMRVVVQKFEFLHHAKRAFTGGRESYAKSNEAFKKKWG